MKADVHPESHLCTVTCSCGNSFQLLSERETLAVEVCSACHPYYTGQQKFVDSAGRLDRFAQRYNLNNDKLAGMAAVKEKKKKTEKLQRDINLTKKKLAPIPRKPRDEKGEGKGATAKLEEKSAGAASTEGKAAEDKK